MKISIIEAVEIFSGDPTRMGKKDTWVTYTVDEARTYQLVMPAEDATEEEIERRIRKAEEDRARIVGKEFEI